MATNPNEFNPNVSWLNWFHYLISIIWVEETYDSNYWTGFKKSLHPTQPNPRTPLIRGGGVECLDI